MSTFLKTVSCSLLLLLTFAPDALAKHIVGGDLTYDCLGGGDYEITLNVYRDDNCTNCADFDQPAFIAIYRGNQAPYTRIMTLLEEIDNQEAIPVPDFPCLIPPDIRTEGATYRFKLSEFNISLPPGDESYHIVYQRCCRNETISNIFGPDDSGATYTVEISPASQAVCNDSPVFKFFPPTVICANEPINFDHSARDADGDQLVYEFCSPLLGGGTDGGPDNPNGDASSCTGIRPNPPCQPPYNDVRYRIPTYTPTAPMGGDPVVTITPGQGEIVGIPRVKGQFVVGVCVSEYRNGVLLGTIRRDFQFNVEDCQPLVVAGILADEEIGEKEYLVNSCGNNTISFINESFERANIDTYFWEFDIKGTKQRFNDWDATVTFPDTGLYSGQMILNPGTTCSDTANIFVNVFPDIEADFSFEYDTCNFGPVTFEDESFSQSGPIEEWEWMFGDGNISTQEDPLHTYAFAGDFPVSLLVTDRNQCQAEITKPLPYFPVPPLIILEPSAFEGCTPLETLFKIRGTPFEIDSTYSVVWDLGDGTVVDELSPLHLYNDPGLYDISVEVTSPIGCFTSADFPNWVDVSASPVADFAFTPENPSNFNPIVSFFDESSGASSWSWDFGGLGNSIQRNPVFTFRDTGLQVVQLVVTHPSGCQDTIFKELDIEPQVRYYLPNAFTPNSDDINDVFKGTGVFGGMVDFSFSIWNRWGELIFETTDPSEGWNGQKNNTGRLSPNGVYVCLVSYEDPRGNRFDIKGVATLVR